MCPCSDFDCDSKFTILSPQSFDGPRLLCSVCVYSSLHLLTRAHCAQCSFLIPLWLASQVLAPAQVGGKTESSDRALCTPVSHDSYHDDQRRVCLSFLVVNQEFWPWCRSCFQQVIRGCPPQKVDLIKFPLRSSYSERTDHAAKFCAAHCQVCFIFWDLSEPSRLVDGKEPVCPFAGTFVMIVGALVTWAIYTQGQLLLW